ncbi:MAG TPA: alkaline phosphatase family protein [Terriglobales bacterium]|jgi:phosphatidylinositol-3-phosphatase|nr:alkaline phosphatase family protein [Terriglobales bacterium]
MRNFPWFLLLLLILSVPGFAQTLPTFKHVFIVLEENHSYSSVIGKSTMPYLNSLADTYGLATQYYANTHPSNGNYFMLTTGEISPAMNPDGAVTADNVVRHLLVAGKTWIAYEENLPYAGYVKPDVGLYTRHHCPLSYLSDVIDSKSQILNLVPFTQFATDLASGNLPDYSFITPNLCDDAHNCSLATADAWLQKNIGPLIQSSTFQDGGLLIITFDESFDSDKTHGGGHVAWVAVSPQFSKKTYKSTTLYQHQNTLRLMMEGLGLTTYPGKAQSAANMAEFFR